MTIKAILTKPLDGDAEGTERDFDKADFARLEAMGAVRKVATAEKPDEASAEKAAPVVANKMAPAVENKAERPARRKTED